MKWPADLEVCPIVSRRMAAISSMNNRQERYLRSCLHNLGVRFRLHRKIVAGTRRTADIVLPRYKVALFVDGCFWHGCPIHGRNPRTNEAIWSEKLARNMERDRDTDARLSELGWTVFRFWEHEDMRLAAARVAQVLPALVPRE